MNLLKKQLKNKPFLIAVHRGVNGANVIGNTTLSLELAVRTGADMVEVDVIRSTDGILYAFHNGEEKTRFNESLDILQLSSTEIDALEYYNILSEKSGRRVEKLEDILKNMKNKTLINIDRAWNYFEDVFKVVKELKMEDQILMKSPPSDEILNFLIQSDIKLMYMPIIKQVSDIEPFIRSDINLVAVEIIFKEDSDEVVSKEFIQKMKDKDILIWYNAINLGGSHILTSEYTDDVSLEKNNVGWEKLLEIGADIIQTDWPVFLNAYREQIKNKN